MKFYDVKGTSPGIYLIKNTLNNKIYIGSTKNLRTRMRLHINKLKRKVHDNGKIQNCYNKYGDIFDIEILENCSEDMLIEREQYYMDNFKPYYNISPMAGRTSGYVQSEESRKKMSISKRKLFKDGFVIWNKGMSPSIETRNKISKTLMGRFGGEKHPLYGKPRRKETREKISKAISLRKGKYSGKRGRIFKLDKNTLEIISVYPSAIVAASNLNRQSNIRCTAQKICFSIKKNWCAYGFKWRLEKS